MYLELGGPQLRARRIPPKGGGGKAYEESCFQRISVQSHLRLKRAPMWTCRFGK